MGFLGHVVPCILFVVPEFDGLVCRSRWATRVSACTYLCIWLVGHCCKLQLILLDFDWHSTWSRIILRVNRWMNFLGYVVPYVLSVVSEFDGLAARSRWATRVSACTYVCIWLGGHCYKVQLILLNFDWLSTWSRIILRVKPWMDFLGRVLPYVLSVVPEFAGLVSRSRWGKRVSACTYLCIWLVGHCYKLQLILLDFDWHSTWSRTILRVNQWKNVLGHVVPYVLSLSLRLTDLLPDPDELRGLVHVRIYVFE